MLHISIPLHPFDARIDFVSTRLHGHKLNRAMVRSADYPYCLNAFGGSEYYGILAESSWYRIVFAVMRPKLRIECVGVIKKCQNTHTEFDLQDPTEVLGFTPLAD
jgi:hypothetical protein